MNLEHIEYIVEIERCGSISKAAKNLYLSQPNLSAILSSFEKEIGYEIFRRYNRGITLTPQGTLFMLSAKNIITEIRNIEKISTTTQKSNDLSICCTYSSTFMETFMEFKGQSNRNDYDDTFKETGLIQTIQDVIDKQYRIALFYCFDCRCDKHKGTIDKYNLEMIPVASNIAPRALVSCSGKYKNKNTISLSELKTERLVSYENFEYEDWLKVLGREQGQKTLFIFDRGGLVDSVIRGNYIGVVMGDISREQILQGCKTLSIEDFPNRLTVYMVKQKNHSLNIREKKFLSLLNKNLRMI